MAELGHHPAEGDTLCLIDLPGIIPLWREVVGPRGISYVKSFLKEQKVSRQAVKAASNCLSC